MRKYFFIVAARGENLIYKKLYYNININYLNSYLVGAKKRGRKSDPCLLFIYCLFVMGFIFGVIFSLQGIAFKLESSVRQNGINGGIACGIANS